MTDNPDTGSPVMLIAGGSGSIGSAIARLALAEGWSVALHGRGEEKLHRVTGELAEPGQDKPRIEGFTADIWDDGAAASLVADVAEEFGRIDAVIDCTATGPQGIIGLFPQTDPASYSDLYGVSVAWLQRLAHAAYPHLQEAGGTLIGFISDAGIFAAPRQTMIGTARAATAGFIRNFAMEAARDGIRAHCISPSFVEGSDSAKRMGSERMAKAARRAGLGLPSADDIAPLAVFLCGDGARKLTGQVISINGGLNA